MTQFTKITQERAVALLQGLVAVPSLSRNEQAASEWLVAQMQELGYSRAYVDEAGNAVGELGAPDAQHTIVLLGHIDTVPGEIPVRIEEHTAGALLYGRGAVDAKGPLATFVAAGANLDDNWAKDNGLRIVIVGAVEEEAATSKGARHIRDRFNGATEPIPAACIIGEPSSWQRVTLGYKGRILVEATAGQPMAHTAGPDAGVATVGVELWNWINAYAAQVNIGKEKVFDQLLPSLRAINTATDAAMQDSVALQVGIRLPLDFDADAFTAALIEWGAARVQSAAPQVQQDARGGQCVQLNGPLTTLALYFHAHEPAWRSERNTFLVRSFLAAIREVEPTMRPSFVVKSGTSDMNVVGPAWHCPILAYGPGDSALDHTPNEHINLDEYWRAVQVLEAALRNLPSLLPTA
ncbi:MAG: M20/M25/M40 family metallo-hydrolase [Caldilineaceae bacterium]|nr:M20/M25/M40 family metallo-hydrolase [Caldilineaceae bacterium]